jgi:hypothetical protein
LASGPIYHSDAQPAIIRVQKEVLLEEGYFKKIGQPEPLMENGIQKSDLDGTKWWMVTLEELGLPLRTF